METETEIKVYATLDDKTGVVLPESEWKPYQVFLHEMVFIFDTFKSMVEANAQGDIPLHVKSVTLGKILQFARHYVDRPEDHIYDVNMTDYDKTQFRASQWEIDFCHQDTMTESTLLDILYVASGYLHFQRLHDVVASHLANVINAICEQHHGNNEEAVFSIRKRFELVDTMTKEEMEMLRQETRWCLE